MILRKLEVSVISDIHLATHACKAKKVLKYLKSIAPETLVLNGDIFDSWRFSRNYFPKAHLKVVRQLIKMLEKGVHIFYITGNHDEFLRKFTQTQMGNLEIINQLILERNGQKTWILHGDIFDHIIHQAKWLAKLGAATYGLLTLINKSLNPILCFFGFKDLIIYKKLRQKLMKEKPELTHFEQSVCKSASEKDCQTVICGHTHVPKDKLVTGEKNPVRYINCGDWLENFTAAEYYNGNWHLFHFTEEEEEQVADEPDIPGYKEVYQSLFREMAMTNLL